ncbi:hypothetical protein N799_09185 [Lysobacter arseniciresistens ZS79]|uniref:Type II secretion system protein GspG C-terminal domain-containing protein n=1 Tax=Lysobacter arseniciresistens ZS79 TaxID=913325 RepID=A0A0A0EUH4_9GAMM|nr:hypothetical protein [Lysobacter arseniciresistens]KGM54591.1 hypothetical protein N799_09185 [Lysobacter arseniciresistens ZS79]
MSGRLLAILASVVVAATVIAAVWVIGSPSAQRDVRIDQHRVQDLQQIGQLLDLYAREHDRLPPDLQTLARQPGQRVAIADPVDGAPYVYEALGARRYRLCARFATDTARTRDAAIPDEWSHGAGRHCFDREAGRRRDAVHAP